MKVKVTIRFAAPRSSVTTTVSSQNVWMVDGFLHVKDGDTTYSYSNNIVEEVIQERMNESI